MDLFTYNPPVAFKFHVFVDDMDGVKEGSFQEVLGLNVKLETEDIQEGGENRFIHKFPKAPKYPNLILKRGMLMGSPLMEWAYSSIGRFSFKPKTILVILLDENMIPLLGWNVINAIPVGLQLSDLKAEENKIMVESIELAYDYFEKISL